MATVREYTDPFVLTYCPVPRIGLGVCDVCHGAANTGFTRCYSCDQTVDQVSEPIELVVPISLTPTEGQFYHVLKSYKNPWGTPQQRMQLAALYSRVLHEHGTCIRAKAGMDWDTVTIVPSSGARTGPHPLENVVSMAPAVGPLYRPLLARGAEAITHNQASDGGYQVTTPVAGRRIVLVDDTFTTGGRVQSAASALQRAGATVVAAVVAGRIINPTYGTSEALWAKQRAKAFRFDQCCLCADV